MVEDSRIAHVSVEWVCRDAMSLRPFGSALGPTTSPQFLLKSVDIHDGMSDFRTSKPYRSCEILRESLS
jgi:hypothetical protein